jgi:hypothetical protein
VATLLPIWLNTLGSVSCVALVGLVAFVSYYARERYLNLELHSIHRAFDVEAQREDSGSLFSDYIEQRASIESHSGALYFALRSGEYLFLYALFISVLLRIFQILR